MTSDRDYTHRIQIRVDDAMGEWIQKQKRGEVAHKVREFIRELMGDEAKEAEVRRIQMHLQEIKGPLARKTKEREAAIKAAEKRLAKAGEVLEEAKKYAEEYDTDAAVDAAIRAYKLGMKLKDIRAALPSSIFKVVKDKARRIS